MEWNSTATTESDHDIFTLVKNISELDSVNLYTLKDYVRSFNFAANETPLAQAPIPTTLACAGDDTSPPNAIPDPGKLNCIALHTIATAGWSTTAPREYITPSHFIYDMKLFEDGSVGVLLTAEFENHRAIAAESMVVKFKVAKTTLCEGSELALVSTQFQDWNGTTWTDITADIAYTATAEAVVTAVLESNSGQTAGMAKSSKDSFDATLGPVGAKGRIMMKFLSQTSYSYDAMSTFQDARDIGQTKLCPLALQLPWAPLSHQQGTTKLSFSITTPEGTKILDPVHNRAAYAHLNQSLSDRQLVIVPELNNNTQGNTNNNNLPGFQASFECLPFKPATVLLWLAVSNKSDDDWIMVTDSPVVDVPEPKLTKVVIYQPQTDTDAALLKIGSPIPGALSANLLRIQLSLPSQVPRKQPSVKPRLILNMNLSDSSGSTSATLGSGKTMREQLNMLSERRLWKRLTAIPALLRAGVLQPNDVYADVVYRFAHHLVSKHVAMFVVADLNTHVLAELSASIDDPFKVNRILSGLSNKQVDALSSIINLVKELRGFRGTGGTDFVAPARAAVSHLEGIKIEAAKLAGITSTSSQLPIKAFVDFDTDGGHNGSPLSAAAAIRGLVESAQVRNGVVTGFGAWVSQECATMIAKVLGPLPAFLAVTVPEEGQEGLDKIFRASLSAWLDALRSERVKVTISAGCRNYQHPLLGPRKMDTLEILAAKRVQGLQQPCFGPPDVQNVEYTKTVIKNLAAGDSVMLYAMSRMPMPDLDLRLAQEIDIAVSSEEDDNQNTPVVCMDYSMKPDPLTGTWLGYDWLTTVVGKQRKDVSKNSTSAVPHMLSRIEDALSFGFNLPAASGATSYLGRAKTDPNRAPIDARHQPQSPEIMAHAPLYRVQERYRSQPMLVGGGGGPRGGGRGGGRGGALRQRSRDRDRSRQDASEVTKHRKRVREIRLSGDRESRSFAPASASTMSMGLSRKSYSYLAKRSAGPARFDSSDSDNDSNAEDLPGYMNWVTLLSKTHLLQMEHIQDNDVGILVELTQIRYAVQRLLGDPKIEYSCDVCDKQFKKNDSRFHCFDCQDYDECGTCLGTHVGENMLHRVFDLSKLQQQPVVQRYRQPNVETTDVLMDEILGPATLSETTTTATLSKSESVSNWTVEINCAKLEHFLMTVLSWWPILRGEFPNSEILDDELSEDLIRKIKGLSLCYGAADSTAEGVKGLCSVATKLVNGIEKAVLKRDH